MARDKGRSDLKADIRTALDRNSEYDLPEIVTLAVLAAVLPHFEAAYRRGEIAGKSQSGYRLVNENERLRRELAQAKEER